MTECLEILDDNELWYYIGILLGTPLGIWIAFRWPL